MAVRLPARGRNENAEAYLDRLIPVLTNAFNSISQFTNAAAGIGFSGLVGTGIVCIDSSTVTTLARTLLGTANEITITNPNGITGVPTFSLPSAVTVPGSLATTTTLSVAGAAMISGAATVTGAATLSSTVNISGASTLGGAITGSASLNLTGAATIGGGAQIKGGPVQDRVDATNNALVDRRVFRQSNAISAFTTILTITPATVTSVFTEGVVEITLAGDTNSIGGSTKVMWWFDISNAAPTVGAMAASPAYTHGSPGQAKLVVSGNNILVQIASNDATHTLGGVVEVKTIIPAPSTTPTTFTLV